ncbi:hypothetical protein M427DRAFT_150596, partial [Gonapodya prolifera JEL478]
MDDIRLPRSPRKPRAGMSATFQFTFGPSFSPHYVPPIASWADSLAKSSARTTLVIAVAVLLGGWIVWSGRGDGEDVEESGWLGFNALVFLGNALVTVLMAPFKLVLGIGTFVLRMFWTFGASVWGLVWVVLGPPCMFVFSGVSWGAGALWSAGLYVFWAATQVLSWVAFPFLILWYLIRSVLVFTGTMLWGIISPPIDYLTPASWRDISWIPKVIPDSTRLLELHP